MNDLDKYQISIIEKLWVISMILLLYIIIKKIQNLSYHKVKKTDELEVYRSGLIKRLFIIIFLSALYCFTKIYSLQMCK
jgi:hypothetical protein